MKLIRKLKPLLRRENQKKFFKISTTLGLDWPSPNGFGKLANSFSLEVKSTVPLSQICRGVVPVRNENPASTPSGLSVVSRRMIVGFPKLGASSCTPPLSEKISELPAMADRNSRYGSGSMTTVLGQDLAAFFIVDVCGLG